MKLKNLYVQKYKNLIDFTADLQAGNGLSVLVGNNGSGKSNFLEVISGIFHDLFKEKSSRKIDSDYLLEYELDGVFCKIEQKKGTIRCFAPKFKSRDNFIKENAPNNVIGLYSGEEDRLWTQFYQSYYNAYIKRIRQNQYQDRMRLMLVDKRYWSVALLALLLSNNSTLEPFIKDELGITAIDKIAVDFDFRYFQSSNDLLKSFINRINPMHNSAKSYSRDELNHDIFNDVLTDENDEALVDENGDLLLVDSGITDLEVFRYLTQAFVPVKERLITGITITVNGGITVQQLSEGEKKLILVKTVLEVLADEKSLLLLDEPDAHLHEGRKESLIQMMRDYQNRQIVVATHSPIMAQLARDNELLMLEKKNGNAMLMSSEKREKIRRLTGNAWNIIGQDMILQSQKPLVVFEGKTDVKYVMKAIQMLQISEPKYQNIKVDFINCGGANNAQFFIHDLFAMISERKKVYLFFDRDDEGKKGAAAVLGISKDNDTITNYLEKQVDNLTVGFIPYRDGVSSGDFLIEDYFLWDSTVKSMVEREIESKHQPLKQLPPLASVIKHKIEENYERFSPEEFIGFRPLVEKIYDISKECEQ